jgi:hypothetical protein
MAKTKAKTQTKTMTKTKTKKIQKLTTAQMASFAARGFIRLEAIVPKAINKQFLDDIGEVSPAPDSVHGHYGNIMESSVVPLVNPGTALSKAYPRSSALAKLLALPQVAGAIESLVGLDSVIDHHFLHITFPPSYWPESAPAQRSQPTHQDSTIDPRKAFDAQLFYFPHDVTLDMGGTRFIPGTHFRVVSEAAIGRYQNIRGQQHVVCPAGTVMFFHMGLWHGGGLNRSSALRYMFKIRMCPTKPQLRLWDTSDETTKDTPRPIFWTDGNTDNDHLYSVLTEPEPWFEADTGRLEYINRVKFWRYISGDENFDADYWVTRIENEYV